MATKTPMQKAPRATTSLAPPSVPAAPVPRRMFRARAMAAPPGSGPGFKEGGKAMKKGGKC